MFDFTEDQIRRYARHIVLKDVGGTGQQKLLGSKVLVVGAGGLGSPLLIYLAAAGIGTLGVVDADTVDLSNLQRQIVHGSGDIGRFKAQSARDHLAKINPEIQVNLHIERLQASNVTALISGYDLIADGTDNFETRFLLNDACYLAGKTLVSAAVLRFDGQIATYKAHLGAPNPCYRCLYHAPPPADLVPSCAQGGVLGAMAGAVGSYQAVEVIKELLGIGRSMSGRLLIVDALSATFRTVKVPRDPGCALCGPRPTIKDLSHHG